jgi:hypothetical protein
MDFRLTIEEWDVHTNGDRGQGAALELEARAKDHIWDWVAMRAL